jgi:hypothetical protein
LPSDRCPPEREPKERFLPQDFNIASAEKTQFLPIKIYANLVREYEMRRILKFRHFQRYSPIRSVHQLKRCARLANARRVKMAHDSHPGLKWQIRMGRILEMPDFLSE